MTIAGAASDAYSRQRSSRRTSSIKRQNRGLRAQRQAGSGL
jgi:hypothetical protein